MRKRLSHLAGVKRPYFTLQSANCEVRVVTTVFRVDADACEGAFEPGVKHLEPVYLARNPHPQDAWLSEVWKRPGIVQPESKTARPFGSFAHALPYRVDALMVGIAQEPEGQMHHFGP